MSSPQRRRERAAQRAAEDLAASRERQRKENLGMWLRINEASCGEDVKDILRRIAEHVGMEMW